MNCTINIVGEVLLIFYILKNERLWDYYIEKCKQMTCMTMQKKTLMIKFLFKKFLGFSKTFVLSGISQTNWHFKILNGRGSHVTLKVIEQAHAFGLDMVKFPSHTSHTLQPLYVSCFKPFKRTFRKESNNAKIKK
jgi:hypothetical protein